MKIELTKGQCESLVDFIEVDLLDVIRKDPDIDSLEWVLNILQAKKEFEKRQKSMKGTDGKDMNVLSKTPDEIKEILDKMQFFGGQRAGRELWMDKPKDIQDADIESFNKDINNIRSYIQQLERERDAAVEQLKYFNCRTCVHSNLMHIASECCGCKNASRWEWRGVKGVTR